MSIYIYIYIFFFFFFIFSQFPYARQYTNIYGHIYANICPYLWRVFPQSVISELDIDIGNPILFYWSLECFGIELFMCGHIM